MSDDFIYRIGAQGAHNLAKHFDTVLIPTIQLCSEELETIKKQLEQLKEGGDKPERRKKAKAEKDNFENNASNKRNRHRRAK